MKKLINNCLYLLSRVFAMIVGRVLFRLKVGGRENLPSKGPFIIVSNHVSFLDSGLIQAAIPLRISWIAKKDVCEKWYLKLLHFIYDTIPVNGAVDRALEALNRGRVLGIFPEGTRSIDGKLKEGELGTAILALKSGAKIVPVGIKGAHEAMSPVHKSVRLRPIELKIGKPFAFKKAGPGKIEESLLKTKRDFIMEKIGELLI